MPNIIDYINKREKFGSVAGTIIDIKRKTPGNYIIDELSINDGTGTIVLAVFFPTVKFEMGQNISATKCSTKEYNDRVSMQVTKNGTISIVGQGNALDATIASASTPGPNTSANTSNSSNSSNQAASTGGVANVNLDGVARSLEKVASSIDGLAKAFETTAEKVLNRFAELQVTTLRQIFEAMQPDDEEEEGDENDDDSD
jgi:hypothetical protein